MSRASLTAAVHAAQLRVYGETVTYTPREGAAFDIDVLWSEDEASLQDGIKAIAWVLMVDVAAVTALAVPAQGDSITRNSIVYRIAKLPENLGDGRVLMQLRIPPAA